MPFSATAVANDFLKIASEKGEVLTSMKLQKLVFFAHGWHLALAGGPLIFNRVEAWEYGPVIPDLYQDFKKYGNEPITAPARKCVFSDKKMYLTVPSLEDSPANSEREDAQRVIERVWELYGKFSASRLSNATHAPGTPWEQVYRPGQRSILIPDQIIKTYFQGLIHAQ